MLVYKTLHGPKDNLNCNSLTSSVTSQLCLTNKYLWKAISENIYPQKSPAIQQLSCLLTGYCKITHYITYRPLVYKQLFDLWMFSPPMIGKNMPLMC